MCADDWGRAEVCAWHCDKPGEGHRRVVKCQETEISGMLPGPGPGSAVAKCLSFQRKVSSVIVMTRLSHVKMDWTPADAKTPIIFHFLRNKFLSEIISFWLKWICINDIFYINIPCVGSGPGHRGNFSHPQSVLCRPTLCPCGDVGPRGASTEWPLLVSSVTGKVATDHCCDPAQWQGWRILIDELHRSLQLGARPTQFQNHTRLSRCSLNWMTHNWLVTGASNSDFYPECGAPAPLGPDQGRCGGVRSGLLGVARIRAGAWCQIKKGAVRPGADAGTRRSQLCVEWEMSEEKRRPGTGLSK